MIPITKKSGGIQFKVHIQPRSAVNAIVGAHGDALKIKLTSPPVAGAANAMCIKFLAKCLQVPKSTVEIIAGHNSRHKIIHVTSRSSGKNTADPPTLLQRVQSLIEL